MAAEPNQMENVRNERIKGVWKGRGRGGIIPRDETWTANELANVIGSYWSLFSPPSLFLREEITVGFTDIAAQKRLLFLLFEKPCFFWSDKWSPENLWHSCTRTNVYLSVQESRKMLTNLVKQDPVFKKKVRKRTISLKNVPRPNQGKYYINWNISSLQILRRYFTNNNTVQVWLFIYISTQLMYSYIPIKSKYCYFRFYFSQWGKDLATVCQSWGQEILSLCLCYTN